MGFELYKREGEDVLDKEFVGLSGLLEVIFFCCILDYRKELFDRFEGF